MLQLALVRPKENSDELVEDVQWAYYPCDILLHNIKISYPPHSYSHSNGTYLTIYALHM